MRVEPPSAPGSGENADGGDDVVARMHGAILREKEEPRDGYEPVPLWLVTAFMVIVFWAGGYLFYFSGGFRYDQYDEQAAWRGMAGGGLPAGPVDPRTLGKRIYTANCAACHQVTGEGVAGQFPPLAGSEIVGGAGNRLALILLHGLQGPVRVKGALYNGAMPAWGGKLKDEQIAAVLTFVRSEWGNTASPIGPQGIAELRARHAKRAESWTIGELEGLAEEELPPPVEGVAVPVAGQPPAPGAGGAAAVPAGETKR